MLPLKFLNNPDDKLNFYKRVYSVNERIILILLFSAFSILVYDLGFLELDKSGHFIIIYNAHMVLLSLSYGIRFFSHFIKIGLSRIAYEALVIIALILALLVNTGWIPTGSNMMIGDIPLKIVLIDLLIFILFLIEVSKLSLAVNKLKIHPSQLFIFGFLFVILLGMGLLLLPNATTNGISPIDALFTSTSAVCVTGLIVLDTSKDFTFFGQFIILVLFQIGGLGIMTFSSFFGFFFKGSYSLKNQLFLRDYINEENIGAINSTLSRIIFFTILVEGIAAVLIYIFLDKGLIENNGDKMFFSVFHAVSGFCNAGFSTLGKGLYEEGFRQEYNVHLIIGIIIIIGGIGFPVVLGYYNYLRHVWIGTKKIITEEEKYKHTPRVVNVNVRLIVYTTMILLVIGLVSYYIFESQNTLKGLTGYPRFVTAFFGAVTPRTAGFNTVDMGALAVPTILIYLILMWIGASPGSTGGGLKTSTFAVAFLNTFSIAKGKDRVEVFNREISNESIRKAFAVILLSLVVISCGVFMVLLLNPEMKLMQVTFEVISAFSTVGLSLGITANLSTGSKLVIAIIMFFGRVGTLTVLVAFIWKARRYKYRYPEETVFIT